MALQLVKLGGSVITREGCEGFFDRDNVARIVDELAPYMHNCILVHGTGIVGKRPAIEHGYVRTGTISGDVSQPAATISASLNELNSRFLEVLFEAGLRPFPMDTPQFFNTREDGFRDNRLAESIRHAAENGIVPVFSGDILPRHDGSFQVMSSDTIITILARVLNPDAVFMFTDVDGVYGRPEGDSCTGGEHVIPVLTESNLARVNRSPADQNDVSGGMSGKVEHALEIARYCRTCIIASGLVPGVAAGVMAGKDVVCTRVAAGRKPRQRRGRLSLACLMFFLALFLFACASPSDKFAGGLKNGLRRVPDRVIAKEGIPASILMVEGALSSSPEDHRLLEAAAGLYSFYGSRVVKDEERSLRLTDRALEYALEAADYDLPGIKEARKMNFDALEKIVKRADKSDVSALFSLGSVWMEWARVRRDDMEAIGDLARIEIIMERVVKLDETYRAGAPHCYLALLAASLPADGEVIESHFSRAVKTAEGKNLMPKVLYALWLKEQGNVYRCGKMLQAVVKSGVPDAPQYMLINQSAMEKAQKTIDELDNEN